MVAAHGAGVGIAADIDLLKQGAIFLAMTKAMVETESSEEDSNPPIEQPLKRKEALQKAKEHAKVPRNSKGGEDVPMNELNKTVEEKDSRK